MGAPNNGSEIWLSEPSSSCNNCWDYDGGSGWVVTGASFSGALSQADPYLLQPGRYPYSFGEVRNHWGFNSHRNDLLDGFLKLLTEVQSVVPVCAVWLAGSFLTSKDMPGDVDVTLVVPANDLRNLQGATRLLVTPSGLQRLARTLNVRVDAYVLPWECLPQPDPNDPDHGRYLMTRGYWDDWWMRLRSTTPAEGALPRRGYVEVIVDGYTP
ncbi:DUF6932 family protein [Mycolicibacterium neoaurum]|uniref:DUF6932 family protein n=1 Tax=Mycolicibacterium neoaurum TaxID=1795 RepID=UPI003D6DA1D1